MEETLQMAGSTGYNRGVLRTLLKLSVPLSTQRRRESQRGAEVGQAL
jgi:hypothetical protein